MTLEFRVNPPLENAAMNALFSVGWPKAPDTSPPDHRHQGVGRALVGRAADEARAANCTILHVDYSDKLDPFYGACGFRPTLAGLLSL